MSLAILPIFILQVGINNPSPPIWTLNIIVYTKSVFDFRRKRLFAVRKLPTELTLTYLVTFILKLFVSRRKHFQTLQIFAIPGM